MVEPWKQPEQEQMVEDNESQEEEDTPSTPLAEVIYALRFSHFIPSVALNVAYLEVFFFAF